MHKTFISYHHSGEQKLKDELVNTAESKDYFIDKSVSDGDIDTNLSEDTIMSKIRTAPMSINGTSFSKHSF